MENAFLEERRDQIIKIVEERGRISTKELSELMEISVVTIRNDINELADRGLIVKTHGGAVSFSKVSNYEPSSAVKSLNKVKEKMRIAEKARDLIQPGDVIILDSGSTTFEIAKLLQNRSDITVVTNDIQIADFLSCNSSVEIVVSGGRKAKDVFTLSGPMTIKFFENLHCDKLFLGCDGIDWEIGITNRILDEAGVKKAMIDATEMVIAVADSSKLGKKFFAKVCPISKLNRLIIDEIDDIDKAEALSKGLDLILV